MGIYAHRFIEVLTKDNQWHPLAIWSKCEDGGYRKPDLVVDDLKLKKHPCFLRRASYGFYSTGALYTFEDICHPIAKEDLSDETRQYIEKYELPVQVESYSLAELEAYADKCREQVFSHLSESFYDRNMQMIMKMLTAAINKEKKENEPEEYQHPKSTFNEYLEEYLSVWAEMVRIHFLLDEVGTCYYGDQVRVVFFFA